jgi:micrococcal nuclease
MYKKPNDKIISIITVLGIAIVILSVAGLYYKDDAKLSTTDGETTIETTPTDKEATQETNKVENETVASAKINNSEILDDKTYMVQSVIDGDTIKIIYNGAVTSVRLIGVNTPETVDPRSTVECFGIEASNYLKQKIGGKNIRIAADTTQTDRDKYNRLLRYIYLDGEDIGQSIIYNGYGYEYTYNIPYAHQNTYKSAQSDAEKQNRGLWAPGVCKESSATKNSSNTTTIDQTPQEQTNCNIKGNISWGGEKIYHVPGQQYYESTKIDTAYGEKWFCTEEEAQSAGWRRSKR